MKIKITLMSLLFGLLILSISQIFSIYPFAGDLFKVYKSGYFNELDNQFEVIADSFLQIKKHSKAFNSWIFLKEIEKKHKITVKVYNKKGDLVISPGEIAQNDDQKVLKHINLVDSTGESAIHGKLYYKLMPLKNKNSCNYCHKKDSNQKNVGILTFRRKFDATIYYTSERITIFVIISLIIVLLLFLVGRWDPEKNIKELFDKS